MNQAENIIFKRIMESRKENTISLLNKLSTYAHFAMSITG